MAMRGRVDEYIGLRWFRLLRWLHCPIFAWKWDTGTSATLSYTCHHLGVTRQRPDGFTTAVPALAVAAVHAALLGRSPIATELLAAAADGDPALATWLRAPGACFVTLQRDGRLRGCVGSLLPRRGLYADIVANARRAMSDPRLPPVDARDWPRLHVDVSVLSAPTALEVTDVDGLCLALRPGVDGLTLRLGAKRATFLPSVWQSVPEPRDFVTALLRKGGWPSHELPAGVRVESYRTEAFDSAPPRPELETA